MSWLVTGGAGYIGAHVVRALAAAGEPVVVLDDLTTGRRERVPAGVPLVVGSVLDSTLLRQVMADHHVSGVVHLAGKKAVAESIERPLHYYRENVVGFESLLQAMNERCVGSLVFSSSAAVYGLPDSALVSEDAPTEPMNPYGATKLVCERMLRDVGEATGLNWVALRYFNVAGAADPDLIDVGVSNLIPMTFQAIKTGRRPRIFGDDYPTADGTCIRDYIHVVDLAEAHLAAVRAMGAGRHQAVYNVGRGVGASVRQVLSMVAEVTGVVCDGEVVGRRAGDPASVVADPQRIAQSLGWRARHGLRDMIASAWCGWPAGQEHRLDLRDVALPAS
jgi:UDP-glucose 4-epimerase